MDNSTLKFIFDNQKDFQSETLGIDINNLTTEERVKIIHQHSHFLIEEAIEMVRPLPYHKDWKDYSKWSEQDMQEGFDEAKEEAMDVFIFLTNVMFLLGIESDEIIDRYCDKLQINKDRQNIPSLGYVNEDKKAETPESKMNKEKETRSNQDGDDFYSNMHINPYLLEHGANTDVDNMAMFRNATTQYHKDYATINVSSIIVNAYGEILVMKSDGKFRLCMTDDFIKQNNADYLNENNIKRDLKLNIDSLLFENTDLSAEVINELTYLNLLVAQNEELSEAYSVNLIIVDDIDFNTNDDSFFVSFNALTHLSTNRNDWDRLSYNIIRSEEMQDFFEKINE